MPAGASDALCSACSLLFTSSCVFAAAARFLVLKKSAATATVAECRCMRRAKVLRGVTFRKSRSSAFRCEERIESWREGVSRWDRASPALELAPVKVSQITRGRRRPTHRDDDTARKALEHRASQDRRSIRFQEPSRKPS